MSITATEIYFSITKPAGCVQMSRRLIICLAFHFVLSFIALSLTSSHTCDILMYLELEYLDKVDGYYKKFERGDSQHPIVLMFAISCMNFV